MNLIIEITNKSFYGKEIKRNISELYAIHHDVVRNSIKFWPISNSNKNISYLVAEEFVFLVKYQLVIFVNGDAC